MASSQPPASDRTAAPPTRVGSDPTASGKKRGPTTTLERRRAMQRLEKDGSGSLGPDRRAEPLPTDPPPTEEAVTPKGSSSGLLTPASDRRAGEGGSGSGSGSTSGSGDLSYDERWGPLRTTKLLDHAGRGGCVGIMREAAELYAENDGVPVRISEENMPRAMVDKLLPRLERACQQVGVVADIEQSERGALFITEVPTPVHDYTADAFYNGNRAYQSHPANQGSFRASHGGRIWDAGGHMVPDAALDVRVPPNHPGPGVPAVVVNEVAASQVMPSLAAKCRRVWEAGVPVAVPAWLSRPAVQFQGTPRERSQRMLAMAVGSAVLPNGQRVPVLPAQIHSFGDLPASRTQVSSMVAEFRRFFGPLMPPGAAAAWNPQVVGSCDDTVPNRGPPGTQVAASAQAAGHPSFNLVVPRASLVGAVVQGAAQQVAGAPVPAGPDLVYPLMEALARAIDGDQRDRASARQMPP